MRRKELDVTRRGAKPTIVNKKAQGKVLSDMTGQKLPRSHYNFEIECIKFKYHKRDCTIRSVSRCSAEKLAADGCPSYSAFVCKAFPVFLILFL